MKMAFWIIFALVIIFIVLPVFTLFKESIIGERPFTEEIFKGLINEYMRKVPDSDKEGWANEWFNGLSEEKKKEIYTSSLKGTSMGRGIDFNGMSVRDLEEEIQGLSGSDRKIFEESFMVEVFYLKRALFMFKVKPFISEKQFKILRSGHERGFTGEYYKRFFKTKYLWGAATRSLRIALISMIFIVGVAYLFAYVINRTTCRFKPFFNAMILLPLVSPPVIMAFALVMLFGRRGIITRGLLENTLHLINAESFNIYGMHGIILAQMLTYGPVAFVMLYSVLAQLDTRIEEAAENLGASRWYIFRRVTLPMSYPGLFRAALISFALSLQDFGNPRIIGGETTMIAGVLYDQMISLQNSHIAAVLGVVLLIPSICAYIVGNIFLSKKTFATKEPGGMLYVKETPKVSKIAFEVACFIFSAFVLALYITIIWGSFVKVWGYDNTLTFDYFTAKGITRSGILEADVGSLVGMPLIMKSVKTMGIAAVIGGLFAVVTGYVTERRKGTFSNILSYLILLTVALPGVVFGIGYILSFNAPFGLSELSLTGTMWIIVLLIIFTRMYGGILPVQAVLQKVDYSVEEAATSLGANRFYTFRRVIFPVLRRPWLLGALYIFISGLVALGGVIFLTSAKHQLASVYIYIVAEQGKFGVACSHSTYLIIVVLIVQMLIRLLEKGGKYNVVMASK